MRRPLSCPSPSSICLHSPLLLIFLYLSLSPLRRYWTVILSEDSCAPQGINTTLLPNHQLSPSLKTAGNCGLRNIDGYFLRNYNRFKNDYVHYQSFVRHFNDKHNWRASLLLKVGACDLLSFLPQIFLHVPQTGLVNNEYTFQSSLDIHSFSERVLRVYLHGFLIMSYCKVRIKL